MSLFSFTYQHLGLPQQRQAWPSSSMNTVGSMLSYLPPISGFPMGSVKGPKGLSATSTPIPRPCSGQYIYHFPSRSIVWSAQAPFSNPPQPEIFGSAHLKFLSDATAPRSVQLTMSVDE